MNITIRSKNMNDPVVMAKSFKEQGWNKPIDLYHKYFQEQQNNERISLIAEVDGVFAGYVNILWESHYPSFKENEIPEINDFNVLIKFRRLGIGSRLMDKAEEIIKERSAVAGLGVGLFSDYGAAQVLYAKRGYIPDGRGIHNGYHYLGYGETVIIDDDVVLYLTKRFKD